MPVTSCTSGSEKTKQFDIVVFGASGFTGQYVVEYLARVFEEEGGLKWAVAGRNEQKLSAVLEEASKRTGKDLSNMPILQANVDDQASLQNMCGQAQLILNCVGPYVFYGEQVVKACIDNKAHHVDISGESLFHERMDQLYHKQAEEAGVYIVEACGFDSIPADIGILYAKKHFDGDLNSVESFVDLRGGGGNYGTYHTVVTLLDPQKERELRDLRRDMFKEKLPKSDYGLSTRLPISYCNEVNGRVLPFFDGDRDIVRRTVRHNFFEKKERPIQYRSYLSLPGILTCLVAISMGATLKILSTFRMGRSLLLKYPRLFTLGTFSKNGPSRRTIEKSSFTHTMIARGWKERLPVGQSHPQGPDKTMSFKMRALDAGYIFTPLAMVESGLVILKETAKLPKTGGVFTPAVAFANTSILDRLQKSGLKFQMMNKL